MGFIKRAFEGRIGRLDFAGRIVFEIGTDLVAIVLISKFAGFLPLWVQTLVWAALAMLLLATVYNVPRCIVGRLHDMGRPGAQGWLMLAPLYNLYMLSILLFRRGEEETDGSKPEPDVHTYKWMRLIMGSVALAVGIFILCAQ